MQPARRGISAAKRLELQYKFKQYDISGDNKLDRKEVKNLLTRGNPNISEAEVAKLFSQIDRNGDGSIDFDEFLDFLWGQSLIVVPAPAELRARVASFCGEEINVAGFLRLCLECKLLDARFKQAEVEEVFAKVLPRGRRKIPLDTLDKLLCVLADKKGIEPQMVHQLLLGCRKLGKGAGAETSKDGEKAAGRGEAGGSRPPSRPAGDEGDWAAVERTFAAFCRQGNNFMERKEFAKLCDDCCLVDAKFHKADADIAFTGVMNPQKRVDVELFKQLLHAIAERKGCTAKELQRRVADSKGPKVVGTQAEANRFHVDRPQDHEPEAQDARRQRLAAAAAEHQGGEEVDWSWVRRAFGAFHSSGGGMDGAEFRKLCEDCGLIDGNFKKTDTDVLFSHHCTNRRMTFEQFKEVLRAIADRKGSNIADVQRAVGYTHGPTLKATKADSVRLHDDRSTYTGAHVGK